MTDIDEKVFKKLNDIHFKKMEKLVDSKTPDLIYHKFPNDDVLRSDIAVRHMKKVLPKLDDNKIVNGLNTLIDDKRLITANDLKGRLYLRKKI
jgi:hypothetical protein